MRETKDSTVGKQPGSGLERGGKDQEVVPVSTGGPKPTHRDPGCVDKTPVEMVQCCPGLFLRPEADEAELTELAIFGELQAAVRQRAKGGKQLPETLLLHL